MGGELPTNGPTHNPEPDCAGRQETPSHDAIRGVWRKSWEKRTLPDFAGRGANGHRIRHYGLFANANRADNIATARALLGADPPAANPQQQPDVTPDAPRVLRSPCPRCGARMIVIEVFARGCEPRWRPTPSTIDTS